MRPKQFLFQIRLIQNGDYISSRLQRIASLWTNNLKSYNLSFRKWHLFIDSFVEDMQNI